MSYQKFLSLIYTTSILLVSNGANAVMIDLTGAGSNGGGYGNSLQFTGGDLSVNVSAYGETKYNYYNGSSSYLFETAEVYSWSVGLGICNRGEGTAAHGCSTNEHEVDTASRDDLLVFEFDETVDFESITVDPYNGPGRDPNDRDIIYWIGQSSSLPNLSDENFNSLSSLAGFSDETLSSASNSFNPYTHALFGTGNILLLSGNYHNSWCKNSGSSDSVCEAYKITGITASASSPVPIPAAVWLFSSALLSLRLKRKQNLLK